MCLDKMESKSKYVKPDCLLRGAVRVASKPRWRQLKADEAFKPTRASIRKHLHREQKRAQLVKLARVLRLDVQKEEQERPVCEQRTVAAYTHRHPGTMAPANTTQFLMSDAEEDTETRDIRPAPTSTETWAHLYSESLSPGSVYSALDSAYEACIDFQLRDFEEVFDPSW